MSIVSLSSLGTGIALIVLDKHEGYCDLICFTDGDYIGMGFLNLFAITGVASILTFKSGRNKQRQVIDAFNQNQIGFHKETRPNELVFGLTTNGIGWVYRF